LVVIDLMKTGSLVEIKTTLPPLRRHFYLVYNKKKLLSARLAHFLDVCRNWKITV
jgi:DNA-binding transcriptional LysR family regulator